MCVHIQSKVTGTFGPIDNQNLPLSDEGRNLVMNNDWTHFVTCKSGGDCKCDMVHPADSMGVVNDKYGYNPKTLSFEQLAHTEKGTIIFLSEFETSKI